MTQFCTKIEGKDVDFICSPYTNITRPSFISSSIAIFAVWVVINVILILYIMATLVPDVRRIIQNYDALIVAPLALLACIMLSLSFGFYASSVHSSRPGNKYIAGFTLSLAGYVVTAIGYILAALVPVVFWEMGASEDAANNTYKQSLQDNSAAGQYNYYANDMNTAYPSIAIANDNTFMSSPYHSMNDIYDLSNEYNGELF